MAQGLSDNVNIFAPEKDILDRAVEGYEENVPLVGQIAAGFTYPGMAMDLAAAGKYGRQGVKDFRSGLQNLGSVFGVRKAPSQLASGAGNLGIAALSAFGAIPLIGDLARGPKSYLRQLMKSQTKQPRGITSLPSQNPRFGVTRHQQDLSTGNPIEEANKMYDRAVRIGPEFKNQIDDIAQQFNLKTNLPESRIVIDGGTGIERGLTKKIPRIVEKARDKYEGDVTQITDPIRRRIIVKNPAEEEAVAKAINQKYDGFDKGREIKEGTGFVDRKINIKFTGSNGESLIAEVGIITEPMWRASDLAHKKYERFRSLFPEGMPTDPTELGKINRTIRLEGETLLKEMEEIMSDAKSQIDPNFYGEVKKFFKGGYVSYGNSGSSAPIIPNDFSNATLDIFAPSTKKSATWLGVANVQSELSGVMKYPKSASPTGLRTAGPSSHLKYNVSIPQSIQENAQTYNDDIFIELDEENYE